MATETELERLIVRLTGDSKQYEKMLQNAIVETQRFTDQSGRLHDKATGKFVKGQQRMQSAAVTTGKALQKLGMDMRALGKSMSMKVTAPIVAFATASVYSYSKFNTAMTESLSIMKTTESQARQMKDLAISMPFSGQAVQAPDELAKSYFYLASAGKDAAQSMALLPQVSKFATAGAFDMSLATDLLTDAQSALGMSSKDAAKDAENMGRLSDILVGANTLANASVQQFSVALTSKAGSAFKSYNIKLEEGIALLAAYADQGIKAELAGNAADRMIRLLSKAARENASEFKRLNISVFDAQGEFRSFKNIIGDMEKALQGMSTKEKSATLEALGFEARVQAVILPLLGTSEALETYTEKLTGMAGITNEVANKQMKSFGNQMKVVWNRIKVVGIEIGEILAPWLIKLGEYVKGATGAWRGLSNWTKQTTVAFFAIVAIIGPLVTIIGTMTMVLGGATLAYSSLSTVIATSTSAMVAFHAAALGLAGVAVVGAIFALRASIAKVNADLDEAIAKSNQMHGGRLSSIDKLKGEDRAEAIKIEGDRVRRALASTQKELSKEEDKYKGGFGGAYRNVSSFVLGGDTREALKKRVEQAKEEARVFNDKFGEEMGKLKGQDIVGSGSVKQAAVSGQRAWENFREEDINAPDIRDVGPVSKWMQDRVAEEPTMDDLLEGNPGNAQMLGLNRMGSSVLGSLGDAVLGDANSTANAYVNIFKGATKEISSLDGSGAKAFYQSWKSEQESNAKRWIAKQKDIQAEVEKTMTPRQRYDREVSRLKGLGLDKDQLNKSLEYARKEFEDKLEAKIKIIPTFDAASFNSAEAQSRIAAYEMLKPKASGDGLATTNKPSVVKDLVSRDDASNPGNVKALDRMANGIDKLVELGVKEVDRPHPLDDIEGADLW